MRPYYPSGCGGMRKRKIICEEDECGEIWQKKEVEGPYVISLWTGVTKGGRGFKWEPSLYRMTSLPFRFGMMCDWGKPSCIGGYKRFIVWSSIKTLGSRIIFIKSREYTLELFDPMSYCKPLVSSTRLKVRSARS